MFGKYFTDFALMAFLPEQINVSSELPHHFLRIPWLYAITQWLYNGSKQVQIIQDWPEPRKVQDIQSFLSFMNFYCRFIHKYSKIALPLMALTQKSVPWHFTKECRSAFNTLKKAFTTALVLTHCILDTQITVETDTSDYALMAVLSITTPSGALHLVTFHSRTFKTAEHNYDVHDKELCAIYEAFQ